jgi:hypothetical protein
MRINKYIILGILLLVVLYGIVNLYRSSAIASLCVLIAQAIKTYIDVKFNIIEGNTPLQYTSCTQVSNTDCATCTGAYIQSAGNICYWNESNKKCGSFPDDGYSKKCTATPSPVQAPTAYKNCSNINDCNTCSTTLTSDDGVCYWCGGKCTSGDNYNADTCSRDPMKCKAAPTHKVIAAHKKLGA